MPHLAALAAREVFNPGHERVYVDGILRTLAKREKALDFLLDRYPIDWARSLSQRPYLTRVYPDHAIEPESGEFVLYRIDRDRIPPEWLAKPLFDYGKDDPQGRPGGPS